VLLGVGAALAAAVVFGVATVLQAVGARRVPTSHRLDPRLLLHMLRERPFVAALVLNFLGFLLHLLAIRLVPLYLAQAGIAGSLVVTAALAIRMFGDHLSRAEWVAVAAVPVGLGVLTTAAGPVGDDRGGTAVTVGLFVAIGLVAVVGAVTNRLRHAVVPGVLGLLAGLGFAADSIAVRLLPSLSPGELWHAAPTYAFLASSALGFLLYSVAMQRGAVAAATAPMIVTQTVAPAVVGVLLLGDQVREGYAVPALVGFVLTTAGAARLARFEGASPSTATADRTPEGAAD
jgi:drug/metabolite transporter (DMT)-like permease